jgi:hypothetical protein
MFTDWPAAFKMLRISSSLVMFHSQSLGGAGEHMLKWLGLCSIGL